MDRKDALAIVDEFVKTEVLRRHLLSVEAAMRAYAHEYAGNPDTWGLAGLLHDVDWERTVETPEQHAMMGSRVLEERGAPPEIVRAVLCHGDHTGVPRQSPMERALYAVDELCGFIIACALVRPTKSVGEVTADGVRKKMKDKRFAAAVNREQMAKGAQEMGVDFDKHVAFVAQALKPVAKDIGLNP